jgi:hypothetical protein
MLTSSPRKRKRKRKIKINKDNTTNSLIDFCDRAGDPLGTIPNYCDKMEEGVEHHQQALLSSEARYLEAEEGRILDEIDAWTRDRGAEVVRSDKLMVLLRSCEQHKGGGEEAAAGVVHTPPVVPCSHSPESQGEGDSATSGKSESDGQTPERHARREAGEEEAEDEEEEEKAEAEWEVELARLEGKMSLTLLKGKRQVQTHKNESESESEEGQVETDCMDKLSAAAVVGSVGAEDTEAGAEAKGPESKHAGESDGKEVRAGMKQLLQRTQVARELVRTEEDYVNFLATGLVSVQCHLSPLAAQHQEMELKLCVCVRVRRDTCNH